MTQQASPSPDHTGVVANGWLSANSTFARRDERPVGRALAASIVLHGIALAAVLAVVVSVHRAIEDQVAVPEKYDLIFMEAPGPSGGGGGGNRMPDPPKPLEMKAAIPKPPSIEPAPIDIPPPSMVAPIQTATVSFQNTGALVGLGSAPTSGSGTGTGSGPGQGPGVGPGTGGGFGGGAMGAGSGAQPPTLLRGVDPKYTTEAMRAKIQGLVTLEALVSPTGAVQDVRVIKSLDAAFGLDQEAMRTARKWLFRPAMFQGQPVAYLVVIEMAFNLR